MPYDDNMTFTLFKNDKGDNPKRPDYRGEALIDGRKLKLSAWLKESKRNGSKFLSGRIEDAQERPKASPGSKPSTPPPAETFEDDVPF